ncbi:MAG: hypothetical protein HZB39_05215 [Planctomycetes bacterium]|nr:hypothetical protein [Planctomycetota bacterium]
MPSRTTTLFARACAAPLLALASCGTASVSTADEGIAVAVPVELAAFVAARVALDFWPSADPAPVPGATPVLREDADTWLVDLGLGDDGPRIASNGRLAPPRPRDRVGEAIASALPVFLPTGVRTRADGGAGRFWCRVTRDGGGSRVTCEASGSAASIGVVMRLRDALALAESGLAVDDALAAGDVTRAAALANQALRLFPPSGGRELAALAAPLWLARKRAEQSFAPSRDALRREDRHAAMVHGLESLARAGFDARVLATAVDDALATGDAIGGLRLLARHWDAAKRCDPATAQALADRLFAATGPACGARVALSEDCESLARRALPGANGADLAAALRGGALRRSLDPLGPGGDALAAPSR